MSGRKGALAVLLLALLAQVSLRASTDSLRPGQEIVPPAPSSMELYGWGLGDRQGLYRILLQQVQDFGDTGGRFTALRDYDYGRVVEWLWALRWLDRDSDAALALAVSLYGQSPDPAQVRQIAQFIDETCVKQEARKWNWLVAAAYLAKHRAHDPVLARKIAAELVDVQGEGIPDWVRQMPSLVEAPENGRTLPKP